MENHMTIRNLQSTAIAILLLNSYSATAIPFGSFDTRSMAMGGAGVAVGSPDAAPLFNPALLSVTDPKSKFSIIIPTVGVRIADPENLRSGIDTTQTALTNLDASVTTLTNNLSSGNATIVANNFRAVSTQLTNLSNKPITAEVGLATVVAVPGKTLGAAFYANGTVTAGGLFSYTDGTTLASLATDADTCANEIASNPTSTACTAVKNFTTSTLTSGVHFKGVQLGEAGFALSHEFQIQNHNVAFGITPKIIKAKLFDTVVKVSDSNQGNVSAADNTAEYNTLNFDLGVAKSYDNGWRTGFVIKNVIPQNLEFRRSQVLTGEMLTLKPQARIGVAHSTSWSTVALDVDLTRNDPAGLEQATQYVALGGELNAWDWAQLRAGYRVDMVNSARNVTSVGLGLAPFGVVHIDLAVAGNANEIGASFQLGVHF
jgi:hypothetical protein